MIENLLAPEVYERISNLQGGGITFGGYRVYLRFTAPSAFIDQITEIGYIPVDCSGLFETEPDIQLVSNRTTTFIAFDPPWTPNKLLRPECFTWSGSNNWTLSGNGKILIDTSKAEVYFQGNGI